MKRILCLTLMSATLAGCTIKINSGKEFQLLEPRSFNADFTQVTEVTGSSGVRSGSGEASPSSPNQGSAEPLPVPAPISPVPYPPAPRPESVWVGGTGLVSFATQTYYADLARTPSQIELDFLTTSDSLGCADKARQALQEGSHLTITGEATISQSNPPSVPPSLSERDPYYATPAPVTSVHAIKLISCELSPGTPPKPKFVSVFSPVETADAGGPRGASAKITGVASNRQQPPPGSIVPLHIPAPIKTLLSYPLAGDPSGCLDMAKRAIALHLDLQVEGEGVVEYPEMDLIKSKGWASVHATKIIGCELSPPPPWPCSSNEPCAQPL